MQIQSSQSFRSWRPVLVINLFLGIFLWFLSFTDFEYSNPYLNLIFPIVVLVICLITVVKLDVPRKFLKYVFCLPSITLGLPYAFLGSLIIINPFAWGILGEITQIKFVNAYNSLNNAQTVEVYTVREDNYEFESYRVLVKLRYRFLPVFIRDICGVNICNAQSAILTNPNTVYDYEFKWIDKDHLSITYKPGNLENNKVVNVNVVKIDIPAPLQILVAIFKPR